MNEHAKKALKALTIEERRNLAARCGVSLYTIQNVVLSGHKPSLLLACKIEREMYRQVTRRDLRPDIDWDLLSEGKTRCKSKKVNS